MSDVFPGTPLTVLLDGGDGGTYAISAVALTAADIGQPVDVQQIADPGPVYMGVTLVASASAANEAHAVTAATETAAAIEAAALAAANSAVAAAAASGQAGLDQTPLPLTGGDPNGWTIITDPASPTPGIAHTRFPGETYRKGFSCPGGWTAVRTIVKNGTVIGGEITVTFYKAPRIGAPGPRVFTAIGTFTTAGSGTVDERVTVLDPQPTAMNEILVEITSGSALTGPAVADQYQIIQINSEV